MKCFGIYNGANWCVNRDEPESFNKTVRNLSPHIRRVWMPNPGRFNAEIAPQDMFEIEHRHNGVTVMGKCFADGALIPKGEAYAITNADCPTLVVWNHQYTHLVAAHAGRDCLFDREYISRGVRTRAHMSVVDAVIERLNIPAKALSMHIVCGIRRNFSHSRSHEIYGEFNANLLDFCETEYGSESVLDGDCIDLYEIVRHQAIENGIYEENITMDTIDTFNQRDDSGNWKWASTRRGTPDRTLRNLVLVEHCR